jgi:hypothetical protein
VDQYGKLIDRHNLWEMVGVRYRRALFPGQSDRAAFSFRSPRTGAASGAGDGQGRQARKALQWAAPEQGARLDVSVRLLYRKIDQYLLNFLFGESAGPTAPVTVLSEARQAIDVVPGGTR